MSLAFYSTCRYCIRFFCLCQALLQETTGGHGVTVDRTFFPVIFAD